MDQLISLDQEIFLLLNNLHISWLDPIVFWATKTITWIPLYAFLIYLFINQFKSKAVLVLLFVGVSIFITDRTTSGFMKPYFERLRPSHEPALDGQVHLVNGDKGGLYGFASSHAANSFGIAMFVWLVLRNRFSKVAWIFAWAFLFSYTRIYLGVHYPGDILVGTLIGVLAGIIAYSGYRFVLSKTGTQH
jgi:undecaprenyl-diphosphatase